MNGYVCFYRGSRIEVRAATSYEAQQKAVAIFKARRAYDVTIVLADVGGMPVTHSTGGL